MGDKRRREEGKKRFFCYLALDTLSMVFVFMVHLFVSYNVLLCFTWLLLVLAQQLLQLPA